MNEKNLLNVDVVEEMEKNFLSKIQEAVTAKDISKIAQLTALGEKIEGLKKDIQSVNQQFNEILPFLTEEEVIQGFDIEITAGMINNGYLSLKPMSDSQINKSIMPADGDEIKVSFPEPIGTITTTYLKQYNRLKDRGHVNAFFEEFGLMAGSIIRFIQIKPNSEYSVQVKQKF